MKYDSNIHKHPSQQGQSLPMGQPGQSEQLPPPPIHKNLKRKKRGKKKQSFAIL
jgi:hypothetical protein